MLGTRVLFSRGSKFPHAVQNKRPIKTMLLIVVVKAGALAACDSAREDGWQTHAAMLSRDFRIDPCKLHDPCRFAPPNIDYGMHFDNFATFAFWTRRTKRKLICYLLS